MLKSKDPDKLFKVSNKRVKESLIHGIPNRLRGAIWSKFLCRAWVHKDSAAPDLYDKLVEMEVEEKSMKVIEADLPRTMSSIITQDQLYKLENILKAYANIDPQTGYAQGMNMITYVLLAYIDDEETVFWCLYDLMFYKNWRLI